MIKKELAKLSQEHFYTSDIVHEHLHKLAKKQQILTNVSSLNMNTTEKFLRAVLFDLID